MNYAVFQREPSKGGFWQGISGGVEEGESEMDAARREAFEEAGIPLESNLYQIGFKSYNPSLSFQQSGQAD